MVDKRKDKGMTATAVRRIRKRLGLTQREFAERVGVHVVSVAKWEAGMRTIRKTHATLIRLIAARDRRR